MQSWFFQAGLLIAAGFALLVWGPWERPSLELQISNPIAMIASASAPPPVRVLLLPEPSHLEAIRAAVLPEQIVASTPEAIALLRGRVIATSIEAAAGPINAAGWAERPIELIEAPGQHKPTYAQYQASEEQRLAEEATSADPLAQSSFSPLETMRILEAMERRGDI